MYLIASNITNLIIEIKKTKQKKPCFQSLINVNVRYHSPSTFVSFIYIQM